jgi:hypothetical protein
MEQVHDLIEAINERINGYLHRTGLVPTSISISSRSYRRLLELTAWEGRIGDLVIGRVPLTEIKTTSGKVKVIIDELISDTEVAVTNELAGAV